MLAACVMGLMGTPAEAQWKWRDKNDRVQYSDLPPPSTVPESAILQRPQGAVRRNGPQFATPPASAPSAAIPASSPAKTVDPELEARRKRLADEEAAKQKVEQDKTAAAKAENCKRAQDLIRTMESGVRVSTINAKGEREYMDDKGRAEETARARFIAAADCR